MDEIYKEILDATWKGEVEVTVAVKKHIAEVVEELQDQGYGVQLSPPFDIHIQWGTLDAMELEDDEGPMEGSW